MTVRAGFFTHDDNRVVAVARWMIDTTRDEDGSPNHGAAMMFAQLCWWLEPDRRSGQVRARHEHAGETWLVRSDEEWDDELGMTRKQALRTRRRLVELGLIECRQLVDGGVKCSHIRRLPIVPETDNEKVPDEDNVSSGSGTITCARVQSLSLGEVVGDADARTDPLYRWEDFWNAYPTRNGRKVGKAKAMGLWRKLSYEEKARAFKAVRHYAAAVATGTLARDAERFLAGGWYEDWVDGPVAPPGAGAPQYGPGVASFAGSR